MLHEVYIFVLYIIYREVVGRLHGWHQEKIEKIGKLRVETQVQKDEQSVEGCTFKPNLIPKVTRSGYLLAL